MTSTTLTTAENFEKLCDQIGACELVRGEVISLSPGSFRHSRICGRACALLSTWAERTAHGRVVTGEAGLLVETDPDTVRGADVAFFSFRRLPHEDEPDGFCATPPELVIEVVGKGQGWGEMVEKAGEYLQMGVDRVWILDPRTERVHVYRADTEPVALSSDEVLTDEKMLPGFSCRVEQFFVD